MDEVNVLVIENSGVGRLTFIYMVISEGQARTGYVTKGANEGF